MHTDKQPTPDWWPSLLLSLNTIQRSCNEDTSVYHRRSPYERPNLYSLPYFPLFLLFVSLLYGISRLYQNTQAPLFISANSLLFESKTHRLLARSPSIQRIKWSHSSKTSLGVFVNFFIILLKIITQLWGVKIHENECGREWNGKKQALCRWMH